MIILLPKRLSLILNAGNVNLCFNVKYYCNVELGFLSQHKYLVVTVFVSNTLNIRNFVILMLMLFNMLFLLLI